MLRPITIALLFLGACSSSSSTASDRPEEASPSSPAEADPVPVESSAETPATPPAANEASSPAPDALASLPHDGPGPTVGERALPFALPDQRGDSRSLDEFLGQGPVAVVFFRSADW